MHPQLIHTGKAVRAMSKERSGSISGAAHAIKTRTENTMETYHFAVNDLESEIVRLLLDTSIFC